MREMWIISCFILWTTLLSTQVTAFLAGAPMSVCLGHHTSHDGIKHQTTEVPFKLSFSSDSYTPGQEINVTLSSPTDKPFKGFFVVAHRTVGDRERPVGTVIKYPEEKAKPLPCVYEENAAITHKNNETITSLEYTWRAPTSNEGDLVFKYMVVVDFETFWIDERSHTLNSSTPLSSVPYVEQENQDISGINWDDCGISKGCFLYPRHCSGSDCSAAVTFRPVQNDTMEFEMFIADNEYIAVGFSHDKLMGKDHVLSCTGANLKLSVQNGYNPFQYYMRVFRDDITNMSVRTQDGNTVCRLVRPRVMEVFTEYWGNETFDLNNRYYLSLAWGSVYENTDVLDHHIELPVVSEELVDFNSMTIVRGSSLPLLTQIHGILMLSAWILLAGITTIVSRYYKVLGNESMLFGSKYWFQIHRACAVLVWTLTATSFVIIFVKVKALSELAELHSYIGIALMSACTLQMLGGLCRPDLDSKVRPVFNIGHWLLGKSCHILAAISFFLAFSLDIIPSKQREFGIITTAVWLGIQLVWEIAFEIRKTRQDVSEKYTISTAPKDNGITRKQTKADGILLAIYCLTMIALLVAEILAVLLF